MCASLDFHFTSMDTRPGKISKQPPTLKVAFKFTFRKEKLSQKPSLSYNAELSMDHPQPLKIGSSAP